MPETWNPLDWMKSHQNYVNGAGLFGFALYLATQGKYPEAGTAFAAGLAAMFSQRRHNTTEID